MSKFIGRAMVDAMAMSHSCIARQSTPRTHGTAGPRPRAARFPGDPTG
eukprot:SAG31_NODE_29408_length_395_cov_3.493243_2_plen_47_part_01